MIRTAGLGDVAALWELERLASSAALGHVFPDSIPFPDDDVLARWRLVLDEVGMTVLIDEHDGQDVGYAAFGDGWLRHFGVVPSLWGTGRAHALHALVVALAAAKGADLTHLWVLVENHRARAFYAREGWRDAGVRDTEVFAPYPAKMQMTRARQSTT